MFMFFALQFSEGLNKLYVNRDVPCPVTFQTAIPARFVGQFYVRAHLSFTKLEHQSKPVVTCPNDEHMGRLMQCEHPEAEYQTCGIHQTVRFPLDCYKGGVLYAIRNFKFTCHNTHFPKKQRDVQFHFELEDSRYNPKGILVAERLMDLKICASPGRDIKNEEEKKGIVYVPGQ
jgi:P53 DNA-binding domain